jgi:hypothetical protein
MRLMDTAQIEMMAALSSRDPEPLIVGVMLRTARQLERRGFAQVGRTDRKGEMGIKLYEVTLTTAGRAHAKGK